MRHELAALSEEMTRLNTGAQQLNAAVLELNALRAGLLESVSGSTPQVGLTRSHNHAGCTSRD